MLRKLLDWVKANKHLTAVIILSLIFTLYFSWASILRYENFYTGRYDLGNMDQTVWNTIRGRIFQTNDDQGNIISRLSAHADFILILIAPLYRIWADPRLLLVLQPLVVAIGAFFIYGISNHILKNKNFSLIFVLAYLLYPALDNSLLYDFHAVVLATTFLLGTYYYLLKRRLVPFLIFGILAGICKEHIWVVLGVLSLFYAYKNHIKKRDQIIALIFSIYSFAAFFGLIWYVIPYFKKGQHFALSYYSDFGESPTQVVKNIFLNPFKTVGDILTPTKLQYLFKLIMSVGFLPVLAPLMLIFAIPELMINLLSQNTQLTQIIYHYTATITPFIFISSIYAVSSLSAKFKGKYLIAFLLFFTLLGAYELGPLPFARYPNIDMITKPLPNRDVIESFLEQIPRRLSIAATNNVGSHLSRRQTLYTLPIGLDKADVVVFLLNDRFAQPTLQSQKDMAEQLKHDKNYIEVFKTGDFIAFEKRNLFTQQMPPNAKPAPLPVSIPTLQNRTYESKILEIGETVLNNSSYTAKILTYDSDGLSLHALYTQPKTQKPANGYPVLILNHGYIAPRDYNTINSYSGVTNFFASHGFIVLKPDYRGNAESEGDSDPTLRRFEYPIDVMNLMDNVDQIPNADPNSIFLYGHSMGGEVTLKVLEIIAKKQDFSDRVKAAVLWAPVTDPVKWFAKTHAPGLPEYSSGRENLNNLYKVLGNPNSNSKLWQSLSPLSYLSDIKTPIALFHGTSDQTVPNEWSIELYNDLKTLGKIAQLNLYPDNDHNLSLSFSKATQESLDFLNKYR